MSTSTGASGTTPVVPGGDAEPKEVTQEQKPSTVSHESFSKVLSEKKKLQERVEAFEKEKKSALEKSGEFEALYREAQAKLSDKENESRERDAKYLYSSVSSQFRAEAVKAGATRIDALEKLVDLNTLAKEVGTDFQVKPDAMKSFLEKAQKENDFLFKKEAATFRDAAPTNKASESKGYLDELKACKSQKDLDAVRAKYGKD